MQWLDRGLDSPDPAQDLRIAILCLFSKVVYQGSNWQERSHAAASKRAKKPLARPRLHVFTFATFRQQLPPALQKCETMPNLMGPGNGGMLNSRKHGIEDNHVTNTKRRHVEQYDSSASPIFLRQKPALPPSMLERFGQSLGIAMMSTASQCT